MKKALWILLLMGALGALMERAFRPANPYRSQIPEKIIELASALDLKWKQSEAQKGTGFILIAEQDVAQAREALETIPKNVAQYARAQDLLVKIKKHEEDGTRAREGMIAKAAENDVNGRNTLVRSMDQVFLDSGQDVKLRLSGPKSSILTFSYILMNRPFIYRLVNEGNILQTTRRAGFTKLIFTDGYNYTTAYDLTAEK